MSPSTNLNSKCSACGGVITVLSNDSAPSTGGIEPEPGTVHHRLLNSNNPPATDTETAIVQDVLSKLDHDLAILDDELSTLQARIESSRARRTSLLDYRIRLRSITSPLRRMPTELLQDIFSWSLPSVDNRGVQLRQSPWLLTHVCSHWRAVSLSMPSLWSLVRLNYTIGDAQRPRSRLLIELQLQRAQRLKIHFYGESSGFPQAQLAVFRMLMKHSTRWEELSLGLTRDIVPLLNDISGRTPCLQKLWLQWTTREDQTDMHSIHCFQNAPALREVGIFHEFNFLTRYESDGFLKEHIRMLKLAPNLVEACLDIAFEEAATSALDVVNQVVDMLHLRRLNVSNPKFLPRLRAPALEALSLEISEDYNQDRDPVLPLLFSLLDRSSCSLRQFRSRGLAAAQFRAILQEVPSITEISFTSPSAAEINALVASLHVPNGHGTDSKPMAPQLRMIDFASEIENHPFMNYLAFLEMLQSRWAMETTALEAAALLIEHHTGPRLDELINSGIRSLDLGGLHLSFLWGLIPATEEINRWCFRITWN
ncbi:F-box domain-containing protein [Favolaschia claudopus]|uniref:F-box domain-containing protein n=1 Tax=Favolaschia claudopus TaxID=2862362 RepID=A0AAW0BFB9_9AGAR